MQTLNDWVKTITNGASWRAIAESLDTTHSTIQRRLKSDTASTIIELAERYNANPIHGLLAAKCITNADLREFHTRTALAEFNDLELAEEIVHRLRQQRPTENTELEANVFELPVSQSKTGDRPLDAVADGSDYHEEENTEFDD
ncbi:hypothetical protein [Corynebacterium sp. H113]|uniref:hypothetical protein n=1 Tax=Corynebacterium sp. H113 TaxID=3133419 RepID=UPI00309BE179